MARMCRVITIGNRAYFFVRGIQKAVRKQAKAKQENHSGLVKKCRTGHPDVIQVSHDSSKADD
jgi:hypothetical protein